MWSNPGRKAESAPQIIHETPKRSAAFQSCPWNQREFAPRNPRLLFDLGAISSAGPNQRNSSLPFEVKQCLFPVRATPDTKTTFATQVPQAPRKPNCKRLDRSRLQPKKLSFSPDDDQPISETDSGVFSDAVDHCPGRSTNAKSIRVFHENINHQNVTPNRHPVGEEATSAKDNERLMNQGALQACSSNKENDRIAVRPIPSSSWAKHNVRHVDSSIAFHSIVKELPEPAKDASWGNVIEWLQPQRDVGLWIQCCNKSCGKWRYTEEYHDPSKVPKKWYCRMQKNKALASCDAPEVEIPQEIAIELIENKYNAGSIVLAYCEGYPWWPGLVCDSPVSLSYFKLRGKSIKPYQYFVVFFNETVFEHKWIKTRCLKEFTQASVIEKLTKKTQELKKLYGKRLEEAYKLAKGAESLTILQRLKKYDYLAWHKKLNNIVKQESSRTELNSMDMDIDTGDIENSIDIEKLFNVIDSIQLTPTTFPPKRRKLNDLQSSRQ